MVWRRGILYGPLIRLVIIWSLIFFSWQSCYAETQSQGPTIWSNSTTIFQNVLVSPTQGSWLSYSAALGFAGLTYWALQHDLDWYQTVQDNRNEIQDKIIPPFNLLGDGLFHIGAYAALSKYGQPYDQQVAAMAIEGQINVAVISMILKAITASPRPSSDATERQWFTFKLRNNSFPSGHTMTAFCAAAIFGRAYQCEWLTYPLAALVGYARIYEKRHWPSDVIAGAGIGMLIGYTVLAFHAQDQPDQDPGIRFTVEPENDGGKLVLSWQF